MYQIVYSMKVMNKLLERGFIPAATFPNPRFPQYMVWSFERTEAFDNVFAELVEEVKRHEE